MTKPLVSDVWKNNYKDYYNGEQHEWRTLGALDKADNIISICKDYPHEKILEVGSGEGAILARMDEISFCDELYSLEISESAVSNIEQRGIKSLVESRIFDGYNIPYDDDFFDLIILSHVLEHVEHPRMLIYEAKRVSKYVFVEVPLEDTIRLGMDFEYNLTGHINFFSPKTLRRFMQTCGLEVLSHDIRNRSYAMYKYGHGLEAIIPWFIKQSLLKCMPSIATKIFTYHGFLICSKIEPKVLNKH